MKIAKEKLEQPLMNEDGTEFSDKTTYGQVLRVAAKATAYASPEGGLKPFNDSPDNVFKLGMVAMKLARVKKYLPLSSEEVTLLKDRIHKLYGPVILVRMRALLDETMSPEKQADKELEEADAAMEEKTLKAVT